MLLLFFFHGCETEKGNYFLCNTEGPWVDTYKVERLTGEKTQLFQSS